MRVHTPGDAYNAAPPGDQVTGSMTYQSHYPGTEPTSPCLNHAERLTQINLASHLFDSDQELNSQTSAWEACALLIRPPHPVVPIEIRFVANSRVALCIRNAT